MQAVDERWRSSPLGSPSLRYLVGGLVVILALLQLALVVRILVAGYGADNDTFLMLGTWDRLVGGGGYVPSRYQGSPLAELSIGASSAIGGHLLSGAVSFCLALVGLWCLYDLITRRIGQGRDAALLVAVLALTPTLLIAASTSHDYIYGLTLFLAGWAAHERKFPIALTIALLGLATLSRLSYLPLALVVLACANPVHAIHRRVSAGAVYFAVVALGYLPAYLSAGSFSVFSADRPTAQGLVGLVGRSLIKPVDLFGLIGTVLVVVIVVIAVRADPSAGRNALGEKWLLLQLGICVLTWVWIPVEPSYLLPAIAIGLVWLARPEVVGRIRLWVVALVISVVVLGWIDFRILSYEFAPSDGAVCPTTEAIRATLDPRVEPGQLLDYPREVSGNRECNELARSASSQR